MPDNWRTISITGVMGASVSQARLNSFQCSVNAPLPGGGSKCSLSSVASDIVPSISTIYYDDVRTFLVCVFIENTQMPSSLDEKNAGGRTPPALKVTL